MIMYLEKSSRFGHLELTNGLEFRHPSLIKS